MHTHQMRTKKKVYVKKKSLYEYAKCEFLNDIKDFHLFGKKKFFFTLQSIVLPTSYHHHHH